MLLEKFTAALEEKLGNAKLGIAKKGKWPKEEAATLGKSEEESKEPHVCMWHAILLW